MKFYFLNVSKINFNKESFSQYVEEKHTQEGCASGKIYRMYGPEKKLRDN